MKCIECGYENSDHAKFCTNCGMAIQKKWVPPFLDTTYNYPPKTELPTDSVPRQIPEQLPRLSPPALPKTLEAILPYDPPKAAKPNSHNWRQVLMYLFAAILFLLFFVPWDIPGVNTSPLTWYSSSFTDEVSLHDFSHAWSYIFLPLTALIILFWKKHTLMIRWILIIFCVCCFEICSKRGPSNRFIISNTYGYDLFAFLCMVIPFVVIILTLYSIIKKEYQSNNSAGNVKTTNITFAVGILSLLLITLPVPQMYDILESPYIMNRIEFTGSPPILLQMIEYIRLIMNGLSDYGIFAFYYLLFTLFAVFSFLGILRKGWLDVLVFVFALSIVVFLPVIFIYFTNTGYFDFTAPFIFLGTGYSWIFAFSLYLLVFFMLIHCAAKVFSSRKREMYPNRKTGWFLLVSSFLGLLIIEYLFIIFAFLGRGSLLLLSELSARRHAELIFIALLFVLGLILVLSKKKSHQIR